MKKVLSVLLMLTMLFCLTACGNDEQSAETESTDLSAVTEQTTEATTEPTTEPTECSHKYTETVTVEATCTEVGELTYTCELCGDSYTEEIEKLEHDYKDATCTAPKTCASCGATEGEKLGHSYKQTASKEATCTAEGSKTYTCSKCGGSYTEKVAKTAHDYKVTTTKEATCTAEGSKTYTCSKCGGSYTETIAKIAHSYKDATCTAPKTCTSCGATDGEALGHSYKDATCTAPKTCTTCGTTEGEALGHDYVDGVCTVCGDSLKGQFGYADGTLTGSGLSDDGKVLYCVDISFQYLLMEDGGVGVAYPNFTEYDLFEYSTQEELEIMLDEWAREYGEYINRNILTYNGSYYVWRVHADNVTGHGIKSMCVYLSGDVVKLVTGYGTDENPHELVTYEFELQKLSNTQYKILTKMTGIEVTEENSCGFVPGMILTWTAS